MEPMTRERTIAKSISDDFAERFFPLTISILMGSFIVSPIERQRARQLAEEPSSHRSARELSEQTRGPHHPNLRPLQPPCRPTQTRRSLRARLHLGQSVTTEGPN